MELTLRCTGMPSKHSSARQGDHWRHLLSFIHSSMHSSRSSPAIQYSTMTESSDNSRSITSAAPCLAPSSSPTLSFTFSTSKPGKCGSQQRQPQQQLYCQYTLFGTCDGNCQFSRYGNGGWYDKSSPYNQNDQNSKYDGYAYYGDRRPGHHSFFHYDDDYHRPSVPATEKGSMSATAPDPSSAILPPPTATKGYDMNPLQYQKLKANVSPEMSSTFITDRRSAIRQKHQHPEQDSSIVPYSRTPSPSPCPSPAYPTGSSPSSMFITRKDSDISHCSDNEEDSSFPATLSPPSSSGVSSSSSSSSSSTTQCRGRQRKMIPQEHVCPIPGCDKKFERRFNLKVHILTHDPQRAHQFACSVEGCNRRFTRKNDMERHVKSVHLRERLECSLCGYHFTRKDGLRRHNCPNGPSPKAVTKVRPPPMTRRRSPPSVVARTTMEPSKAQRDEATAWVSMLVDEKLEEYRRSVEEGKRKGFKGSRPSSYDMSASDFGPYDNVMSDSQSIKQELGQESLVSVSVRP